MSFENNKLGMSILISHPAQRSIDEQIRLFAKTGFDSFFLSSGVTDRFDRIPEWSRLAGRHGIAFEAVHNPAAGVDSVWQDVEAGKDYETTTRKILDLCSAGEVSKLVLHVGALPTTQVSDAGLEFWGRMERYAKARGVKLCYENSNVPELFAAVVENADGYHGICHDVGHQLCYTPEKEYEKKYAGAFQYTHLHDNLSDGRDMHLLPGDGKLDWPAYLSRLEKADYQGTLNLELSCYHSQDYREMTFERFVRCAYERLDALRRRA